MLHSTWNCSAGRWPPACWCWPPTCHWDGACWRAESFLDLAIAQIAVLGVITAHAFGLAPQGWPTQLAAAAAALAGAAGLALCERRWPEIQEALIGSTFVVAASLSVLLLAGDPHGGEHLSELLTGQILWATPDAGSPDWRALRCFARAMGMAGQPVRRRARHIRLLSDFCAGHYRLGAAGGGVPGVRQPDPAGAGGAQPAFARACWPAGRRTRRRMRPDWRRLPGSTGRLTRDCHCARRVRPARRHGYGLLQAGDSASIRY